VATGISEKTLKREGVCAASLPTTMGIVAGLLVQNTIKLLLGFGSVSHYLAYNAMLDFFSRDVLKPNTECTSRWCVKAQAYYQEHLKLNKPSTLPAEAVIKRTVVHEDNNWGISVVGKSTTDDDEDTVSSTASKQKVQDAPHGTYRAYQAPMPSESAKPAQIVDDSTDLADLMQQLKTVSSGSKKTNA